MPKLELRVAAYREFEELRPSIARVDLVKRLASGCGISKTTVYDWYKGSTPMGRRAGHVSRIPELLYVIGALLGDGCIYHWRENFQVWLAGEREFAQEFAGKLTLCIGREVHWYKFGSKNAWFVRVGNAELFFLLREIRKNLSNLQPLLNQVGRPRGLQELIEGFFDAEGCVKVVRGQSRRTPKICLDITNTDFALLDVIRDSVIGGLSIRARYSIQREVPPSRTTYHLRIYREADVEKFLASISTPKLLLKKKILAEIWFSKKTGRESPTSRPSQASSPRRPS